MWRTRFSRAWDWLRSRKLVGEDEHHLYYTEFIERGKRERRYVEYKDQNITHSSDRMPVEWWSWLHNRRNNAPSVEEIALSEVKQEQLAERVSILEAEDEKQRLRQFAGSMSGRKESMTEEEIRAKRRKNVMVRLAKAASPASPEDGKDVVVATEVESMPDGEKDEGANTQEEAQVRLFGTCLGCLLFAFVLSAGSDSDLCMVVPWLLLWSRGLGRSSNRDPGNLQRAGDEANSGTR